VQEAARFASTGDHLPDPKQSRRYSLARGFDYPNGAKRGVRSERHQHTDFERAGRPGQRRRPRRRGDYFAHHQPAPADTDRRAVFPKWDLHLHVERDDQKRTFPCRQYKLGSRDMAAPHSLTSATTRSARLGQAALEFALLAPLMLVLLLM